MKRRKAEPLLSPLSAAMILAALAGLQLDLRRNGVDGDVQEAVPDFVKNMRRQHDRKRRAQALRLRRHWRKADVDNLLLLPGKASQATQRLIRKLLLARDGTGRGVVPEPKSFGHEFVENLALGRRFEDPTTTADKWRELHRKMPTYPRLIESAYRGEKERLERGQRFDRGTPSLKPSEYAEANVAEAAGISVHLVHKLCQQVRDDYKKAQLWAAARPLDRGLVEEPKMTADELRLHLDELRELADLA